MSGWGRVLGEELGDLGPCSDSLCGQHSKVDLVVGLGRERIWRGVGDGAGFQICSVCLCIHQSHLPGSL